MAVETSLISGDRDTLKKLCYDLSRTERNFLLKKGETTIALRTEELSQTVDKSFTDFVEKFFREKSANRGANTHDTSSGTI
jgi:hypothetical protein